MLFDPEVKCDQCGELFIREPGHAWKQRERKYSGDTRYFCSYTCREKYLKRRKVKERYKQSPAYELYRMIRDLDLSK